RLGYFKDVEQKAKVLKHEYDRGQAALRDQRQAAAQIVADADAGSELPAVSAFTPPPPNKVAGGVGAMHSRRVARIRVTDLSLAMKAHPGLFKLDQAAAIDAAKVAPLL